MAILYLRPLSRERRVKHGETMVQWSCVLKLAYKGSHNLRSLFTDQPTVVYYPIYSSLSFLNLSNESSSDFCLPHKKGSFVSHLRAVCVSRDVTIYGFVHWLLTDLHSRSQGNLYHMSVLITWKQFRFTENQTTSVMNGRCRNQKNAMYV